MEQILKEYEMLRQEINQKIELHNTLLTFTITSTILVLTVAASEKMTSLYLFPFCVIIPMLLRIAYYRKTMAKLSAYMIVFLETGRAETTLFQKSMEDCLPKSARSKLAVLNALLWGVYVTHFIY